MKLIFLVISIFWSCTIIFGQQNANMLTASKSKESSLDITQPPQWAREAIWYQIFVERFRNGNPNNDPTVESCDNALIDPLPKNWSITPWNHNWYEQEDWAKETGLDFYRTIQMRRYGGDLDGVLEKIPYLQDLGITAVYFNPINDAPSLHKYDARHYHHIDITFGDDSKGDWEIMSNEQHNDPKTWQWTSADKKFLMVVQTLHKAGIKVILDYSWNHTGNNFWAFKDVEKNLDKSQYKDWYHTSFHTDSDGKMKMDYEGWYGIKNLPELKKINTEGKIPGHPYEGNINEEVKKHIFDVCKRWMDPHGDGTCRDGIDGMRLDVAEHVPVGFWRDFRKYVRSINHEFYLVGENWWTNWPDELMDPQPWVKGDIFDAVMHYQWYKIARGYFAQPNDKLTTPQFMTKLDSVFRKYPNYTQQSMMNLAASHDSPRLLSAFFNINKYKYHCKPQEDPQYRTNKPGEITYHQVKLFLLHQFTFVGSPHIWNGDEMGMTGADDPDNRKPLLWPDIDMKPESQSAYSQYSYSEKFVFDKELHDYYKDLISLRKSSPAFSVGEYEFVDVQNQNILAYLREHNGEKYIIIFNVYDKAQKIEIPKEYSTYTTVFEYNIGNDIRNEGIVSPYSGIVLKK